METTVSKNKTARVGDKYSYKYVDIAQIHDYLEQKGLSYYQYIDRIDGDDYIMTVRIIDGQEKEPLRGARVVDATLTGNTNPAQQQGSALTYARRYSLLMAFGLATEDGDAQSLNIEERKASPKQVAVLEKYYTGEALEHLIEVNNVNRLSEISMEKASDLISKLKGEQA